MKRKTGDREWGRGKGEGGEGKSKALCLQRLLY